MPDPITQQVTPANTNWEIVAGLLVTIGIAVIGFLYSKWQERKKENEFISQIDSSIRDTDALLDSAEHAEAINKYDSVLNTISPQKYPNQWEKCKNSIGIAYFNLSLINNKELNLKGGIQAFQRITIKNVIELPVRIC